MPGSYWLKFTDKFFYMITLLRTDSENKDFISLVQKLDADLAARDGADHDFYDQYNKIDAIKHVVIAYEDQQPVACGAMKAFETDTMEIKRMFVDPAYRGKGLATRVLLELE